MQIDGLRHVAVYDEVSSLLDRQIWEKEKHLRPPHVATPEDADSKASICRYTYDVNEIKARGETVVLEEYPKEDKYYQSDVPNAALDDILPRNVIDACAGNSPGFSCTVMMQGFDWMSSKSEDRGWWRRLAEMAPDIAALGVTHVWLPPPSQSVAPEGYLPGKLWNLDVSAYGTEAELLTLNRTLKENGVIPMCDIVINHRTADVQGPDGVYNVYSDDVDDTGQSVHWGTWAITCDDPEYRGTGSADSGANYHAAPDLDHRNPELRDSLKRWLGWLKHRVGFGGFRFDFVRGYAPEYTEEYIRAVCDEASFCVGENWVDMRWEGTTLSYNQDGPRGKLIDWIDATHGTCALFDFPTKGILQRAIQHSEYWRLKDPAGRPPGLMGWVPARAVTFTDNHDTGHPQNHWPFPVDRQALGYAYILTHPGIPCIFGPHFWDRENVEWQRENLHDVIAELVDIRRRNEIKAESHVHILMAEAEIYVARIAHRLTVKLGPMFEMPRELLPMDPEWRLAVSGEDFAVWERVQFDYAEYIEKRLESQSPEEGFVAGSSDDESAENLLLGGNLSEGEDPPSIGSFFEAGDV